MIWMFSVRIWTLMCLFMLALPDCRVKDAESACHGGCQDGWLSPRTKFVLHVTAEVAQDLVRHTGEFAEEFGHTGGVYLAHHIDREYLPEGTQAAPLWVEGFSAMFEVIADIFESGRIPTAHQLDNATGDLRYKEKWHLFQAYGRQGADAESVLEALVYGAKDDWEDGEFEDTHCEGEEWTALPTCPEHDFDWDLALDILAG
ncbi:hypothetical protein DFH07DRAFT_813213 [Mycena maculata]|uniref:Uncharacterized protein n=1 Tax=Mycena maculata TaxID=230809 RepID=A0AAD7JDT6_9AGAR|nr:hypothetical protein DFH07DRAFT_813213 [Mycena maculata]